MLRARAILIAALIALTCTGLVYGQSQPTAPTPTETSLPPQADIAGGEETTSNGWLVVVSGIIAFFTSVLAVSTIGLWYHTHRIAKHTANSERAYVTMSHEPPGLNVTIKREHAVVTIEIKNYGRTPATVTDLLLQLDRFGEDNPAPDKPKYRTDAPRTNVGAFLVADTSIFHTWVLPNPNEGDGNELWLFGYVDYSDAFGQHHRAGYARTYRDSANISGKANNLFFVNKDGWNYDKSID